MRLAVSIQRNARKPVFCQEKRRFLQKTKHGVLTYAQFAELPHFAPPNSDFAANRMKMKTKTHKKHVVGNLLKNKAEQGEALNGGLQRRSNRIFQQTYPQKM